VSSVTVYLPEFVAEGYEWYSDKSTTRSLQIGKLYEFYCDAPDITIGPFYLTPTGSTSLRDDTVKAMLLRGLIPGDTVPADLWTSETVRK
jgi:hypothetical protein